MHLELHCTVMSPEEVRQPRFLQYGKFGAFRSKWKVIALHNVSLQGNLHGTTIDKENFGINQIIHTQILLRNHIVQVKGNL